MQTHRYKRPVIFLLLFLGTSCRKNGLITYNTTNSIYFNNIAAYPFTGFTDSTGFTFAYTDTTVKDSMLGVVVNVTGSPADHDRTFKMVADPSSTAVAGEHYEKLPASFTIPAHQVADTQWIKLHRTPDLRQNSVSLVLALEPGGDFTTNFSVQGAAGNMRPISYRNYQVIISDILLMPASWDQNSLGKFSPKKMYIVAALGGVQPSWWITGDPGSPPPYSTGFQSKQYYLAALLVNYLQQEKNAGTPVYYEDGVTLMATTDGN